MPPALLYHAVLPLPSDADREDRTLVVDPADLAWQLEELARARARTLTLDEFHAGEQGVLITFDDAFSHVFADVTPLLERHGQTAVMFVPWANVGGANDWDSPPLPVAGLEIADAGMLAAAAAGPWEL